MTTTTKTRPAPAASARDVATTTYLAQVARAADGEPVDLAAALVALAASIDVDVSELEKVASAAQAVASAYRSRLERWGSDYAGSMARDAMPAVVSELQGLVSRVVFDGAGKLAAAEADVEQLERTAAAAAEALEVAAETAQFEQVMQLRAEVEVAFPSQIGEARLRVLALQIEQAQAEAAAREATVSGLQEQRQTSVRDVDEAQKVLDEAQRRLQAVDAAMSHAAEQHREATRRATRLEEQRSNDAEALAVELRARTRRLTGLDADPAAGAVGGPAPAAADVPRREEPRLISNARPSFQGSLTEIRRAEVPPERPIEFGLDFSGPAARREAERRMRETSAAAAADRGARPDEY